MRARLLLALLVAAPAAAQDSRIGGRSPATACVVVEIAGERVGHLDCAAARIEAAARRARQQAETGRALPAAHAGSPDTTVGVASVAGTRLRMGAALGTGARPARPIVAPVNPMAPR